MTEEIQQWRDRPLLTKNKVYFLLLFTVGCSTVPRLENQKEQAAVLAEICSRGQEYETVHGSIWIKLKDKENQGQFPAQVRLDKNQELLLEIQSLLGARMALIKVNKDHYRIDSYSERLKSLSGGAQYLGIPNQWIIDLFKGKLPCPKQIKGWENLNKPGMIEVVDEEQRHFEYQINKTANFIWVDRQKISTPDGAQYEFRYSDPENLSSSPRSWEIRTHQGELSFRWRDKQVTKSK